MRFNQSFNMMTVLVLDGLLTIKCELDTTVEVRTMRHGFAYTDHPIIKWIFHIDKNFVSWDDLGIEDKLAVTREFMRSWYAVKGDVIPWGDDIETLVALERM